MLAKSVEIKPTRYFIVSKDKTNKFFQKAKVNSCSYVLVKNGQSLAVPYKIINSKGLKINNYKLFPSNANNFKSVYQMDYNNKPYMHVGMKKKPLIPYDQYSYRSRLPITDIAMGYSNQTNFTIGNPHLINRKQWISTSKDCYSYPKISPVTNSGILSDMAKMSHEKLESIN